MPITKSLLSTVEDERLKSLIYEALENNYDLRATALRLKAEGFLLRSTQSGRLPQMSAEFAGERNNQMIDGKTGRRTVDNQHRLALNLSWEIDIWGRWADDARASQFRYNAREYEYLRARDALAARVVQAWIEQIVAKKNLDFTQTRVDLLKQIETDITDRYTNGIGTLDDLAAARARSELAKARSAELRAGWSQSIRQLEVLLGRYPKNELLAGTDIPIFPVPNPKTPTAVLLNRPDVKAGLANVESAIHSAKSARKAMLPTLKLSTQAFKESTVIESLRGAPTYWTVLGSLFQPIFEGGRLIDEARARNDERLAALMDLRETALQAMKEVEDGVDLERQLASKRAFLENALAQSEKSLTHYQQRYREGLTTFYEFLSATEQLIDTKIEMNVTVGRQTVNRIELMLALGTGVSDRDGDAKFVGDIHANDESI